MGVNFGPEFLPYICMASLACSVDSLEACRCMSYMSHWSYPSYSRYPHVV
jgi:hypothetical protein